METDELRRALDEAGSSSDIDAVRALEAVRARVQGRRSRRRLLASALAVTGVVGGVVVLLAVLRGGPADESVRVSPSAGTVRSAPLTGLSDPTGAAGTRSAVSVEIDNESRFRPQSGLDSADVVYEQVVAGGITRFWAVFQSSAPSRVGPIRDDRRMDPAIVSPLHGVVTSSGSSGPAIPPTAGLVVDPSTHASAFSRDASRASFSNLYVRPQALWQLGAHKPPSPLFHYSTSTSSVGQPVDAVHLGFADGYDVTYQWDPARKAWLRSQGGQAFRADTGGQIASTNVIVQLVPHRNSGGPQVLGAGDAWILRDGRATRGRWSRPNANQQTRYTDTAGKPIGLTRGRTWVELLPTGSSVQTTPRGALSARIVLPSQTMTAGSTMAGHVVIENKTGHALHAYGCGSLFQVALGNDTIHPGVAWLLCRQPLTIPVGESRYPVTVAAFYLNCSAMSVPPCPGGSNGLPLPPGNYEAMLYQSSNIVPAPTAIDVRVTE